MAETYANNIDRANDFLSNYRQGQAEQASEAATNQLEQYQEKVQALRDHYTHEAAGGGEEIGGAAAFHAVYGKLRDMYKKYKGVDANDKEPNTDKEEKTRDDAEEDDGSGQQEIDDAGAKPEGATETADAPTEAGNFEGEFTGRGALSSTDRIQARLRFLNENFPSEPAPAGASPAPRTAPEPAGQGGNVEEAAQAAEKPENPFSFSSWEKNGGSFEPAGEATEESAFGDLSNIPKPGTAADVMAKIDAQAATERGGNIQPKNQRTQASSEEDPADGSPSAGSEPTTTSSGGSIQETNLDDELVKRGLPKPAGGAQALEEGGEQALEEGGEKLAEKAGTGLLGELGASVGLDAIPVIGEAAAVVQGLVGIGEGIYHLFHPDNVVKPKAPVLVGRTPAQISAKFSSALPDIDGSVEDSAGSVSAF